MWGRGDLGQCVYMLLVEDPQHVELLEAVVAASTNDDVAWQAALILIELADEGGLGTLNRLVSGRPALRGHSLFGELHGTLHEHGRVSMF